MAVTKLLPLSKVREIPASASASEIVCPSE